MKLITASNERYFPRIQAYLESLNENSQIQPVLVCVGERLYDHGLPCVDTVQLPRALNLGAPQEVEGDFQGCATINYPERRRAYTRVLEHKHFGWQQSTGSIVTMEYPETYERGTNEPYYPVRDEANAKLYEQYKARAAAERWLIIGGRLGMFQYLNMDQAIGAAITTAERLIGGG